MCVRAFCVLLFLSFVLAPEGGLQAEETLRVGIFEVDATPPLGSPLAYDPMQEVVMPLSCRGVVLLGLEKPVVLCSVDWIGIGNDGNKVFRRALAEAAGTTPERVALHTVHQHDAPQLDFSAERIMARHDRGGQLFNVEHARQVIADASAAVARAVEEAQTVTHLGLGAGVVDRVASNRRILGPDGRVAWTRYTSGAKLQKNREAPVGRIDPKVRLLVLLNEERPLVALTYYACHPQSYYRTGGANPDFPGIARRMREAATDTFHVHFNGAGGNIGAGKWNDGSPPYRQILADRLAAGMGEAWETMRRVPITASDAGWDVEPVRLPLGKHLVAEELEQVLSDPEEDDYARAARSLAWARRCEAGDPIEIQCLRLGPARVLHMPGELCVEYQLAAQGMREDLFVAMAAYGDYAPGYICPEIAYAQGGYEASERASRVAPEVEGVLHGVMQRLLEADPGVPSE